MPFPVASLFGCHLVIDRFSCGRPDSSERRNLRLRNDCVSIVLAHFLLYSRIVHRGRCRLRHPRTYSINYHSLAYVLKKASAETLITKKEVNRSVERARTFLSDSDLDELFESVIRSEPELLTHTHIRTEVASSSVCYCLVFHS